MRVLLIKLECRDFAGKSRRTNKIAGVVSKARRQSRISPVSWTNRYRQTASHEHLCHSKFTHTADP